MRKSLRWLAVAVWVGLLGNAPAAVDFPGLKLAEGFNASLVAKPELGGNAVAICFDSQGRLYSVEANRRLTGTWGVTMSRWWSMEDYAGKTLEDRQAMYDRWTHIVPPAKLVRDADVLRRFTDADGDGIFDESKILREYRAPLDGNAAGIIARDQDLFVANAPSIWRLNDHGEQELLRGLGVRVGVYGHDLHGLVWGPDGRLYFSIGDRGFHLTSKEGKTFSAPTRGGVFRCFPDGSGLELIHVGLRNPQDLAFNEVGDLFTVDNDMGGVDKSRVVHVVEGGDSGWDASYQLTRNFREETKRHDHTEPPWFTENLWKTNHPGQPRWLHPPVGYLTHGPSGMEFDPGWGSPKQFRNSFYVCDFRGTSARSGIYSFHLGRDGAGYQMTRTNTFAWGILPADIEFGWDGRLYLADWIGGWGGNGQRRMVRLETTDGWSAADANEVTSIMRQGFSGRSAEELLHLLAHQDRRVRQFAQFELAARGDWRSANALFKTALFASRRATQLHGIWGLWQMGLAGHLDGEINSRLGSLLVYHDHEIRAQTARVLGDLRVSPAEKRLLPLLADPSARVRYFAAEALGKLKSKAAVSGMLDLLEVVGIEDRTEIHAIALALSRILPTADLVQLGVSARGRMAIVLALRHQTAPELRQYLRDPDSAIVHEAARAIHDLNITDAFPDLANPVGSRLFTDKTTPFPILHRVLNANFRLGTKRHAARLATLAANSDLSTELRLEALKSLEKWDAPSPFDRVTWHHRPITGKRAQDIGPFIQDTVRKYLFGKREKANAKLLAVAGRLAVKYDLIDPDSMNRFVRDTTLDEATRIEFLNRLVRDAGDRTEQICRPLLKDKLVGIRLAAAKPLLDRSDQAAEALITSTWKSKTVATRQSVLRTLAKVSTPFAHKFLSGQIGQDAPTALDALEAGLNSGQPALKKRAAEWLQNLRQGTNRLGEFALTLSGGDKAIGKRLFATHAIQCVRCHQIKGFGGDAGPELTKIGRTLKPDQLVESLIEPSARIAEGFGTFEFELKDGESIAGFVRSENNRQVELSLMDGRHLTILKKDIAARSTPKSAMPTMREVLTRKEIRDLVAYLTSLR